LGAWASQIHGKETKSTLLTHKYTVKRPNQYS
jgi:hypothetical protein